jgi:4-amino-4-deoxy-L-arabinose transferase-like glycosyltransferase
MPDNENPKSKIQNLKSKILLSLVLFLLALIPRLPDLGRFLTADEFLWVDRSRNFLAGMLDPAYRCTTVVEKWAFAEGLACTLRTGHPGVTTMWTGSLGLWLSWVWQGGNDSLADYLGHISTNPLDAALIAPSRLGTVIITSLWVVAVYWLSRHLFGRQVALVGACLLALDPFHIALSRVIHHDALSTTFVTLSVLAAFSYWGETEPEGKRGYFYRRRWLLLSGVVAGLGFLSKSPALYLMPYIALVGLWFTLERLKKGKAGGARALLWPLGHTVADGLLWFGIAAFTFCLGWPAMWVVPLEAVETVFFIGSKYATGGHAKGNYFLGEISQDPGALFYPVTWLYRTLPLTLLGVVALLVAWPFSRRQNRQPVSFEKEDSAGEVSQSVALFFRYLPLILLFILGYYLLMTIGEKKQDRYFLPVYPWANLMAGAGLVLLADYLRGWFRSSFLDRSQGLRKSFEALPGNLLLLVALVGLVHGSLVFASFPYYFTYYNPLFGGIKGAAKTMTVGWGEGLDLAADYLNQHVDTEQTRVASWYESTFAPFYDGPSISYSKEKGKALAGDYVIFYINQTQRLFPDEVLFDYFSQRSQPEKIITLEGVEYAQIYPSLGIDHYGPDQVYTGIAALLAWQWVEGDSALAPGETEAFEIYWENLGKDPAEPFFFRLVDAQNRPWAEASSQLVADRNPPLESWREGEIIYEAGTLALPPDLPPGQYQLQVGFYTQAPAVTTGELLFPLLPEEALVSVGHNPNITFTSPQAALTISQPLGSALTLLAANWPQDPLSREAGFPLDLYWRVEQPLSAEASLHVGLMDEQGEARQAWFNLTLAETFNPIETTWQPGDLIHTRWQLQLLPEVTPGNYRLELVLPDDPEQMLPVGQLVVEE